MAEQPMLKFVSVDRDMPTKRDAGLRNQDFNEIYAEYASVKAQEQASRCSQCGVPYCQTHCPLHNNIPDWLRLTAEGRLEEAYNMSQATNTFPEICGRICPQDRLCEGNCVIEQSGHGTVTIGAIEKYITDTAWEKGWAKPLKPAIERFETVGIIGAGPAGLMLGRLLMEQGISSVILETKTRDYVESRIRAGVLENGTVELLKEAKADYRLKKEGQTHNGLEFSINGQRSRIDLNHFSKGKSVIVYGQTEITIDLISTHIGSGGEIIFNADNVLPNKFDTSKI